MKLCTAGRGDLRSQVGQLLILGFDGLEVSAKLRTTLETLQPGGVILFARNLRTPQQTWTLLHECQRAVQTPMFLCVDMEGGTVDRLKDVIAPAPAVADVAATGNRRAFRLHGRVIGDEVRALGFNTDFAPCVDLGLELSRRVLTSRTASADPKEVVAYAREFLRGLKDAGVLGCGKHFPGLGEANLDTHQELPEITKTSARLFKEDLQPYQALHRQMPFIMVAHAAYPAVTKDRTPASLSKKWIEGILRKRIGYRGLIISDDLEMGGVQKAAPIEEAAIQTIAAGADIFLVCHNAEFVWRSYEAVLTRAERDRRFAARVADSAGRVLAFKKKSKELKHRAPLPTQEIVDRLRRELWEFAEDVRLVQAARA
jgi:beta-N-acetylhexosaminidase